METLPPDLASAHSASNLMQSKLTILIPTWNRKKYLEALLNVLLPQLLKRTDVDLIVSNNGSADGTIEYLETLRHTPRTIIIHQPVNLGAYIHLAWLYGQARGEYLWMIGDDDLIEPDTLDIVCQTLYANPGIGWLHLPGTIKTPDGSLQTRCPPQSVRVEKGRKLFAEFNAWLGWITPNIIATRLLQPELLSVRFSTAWWPWQLLMRSVANHPAVVLATRKTIGEGGNIHWVEDQTDIDIIQMPRMLFESDFLTKCEKSDIFYALYHGDFSTNFARLSRRDPLTAWRVIRLCPSLLDWNMLRAFMRVVSIKFSHCKKKRG